MLSRVLSSSIPVRQCGSLIHSIRCHFIIDEWDITFDYVNSNYKYNKRTFSWRKWNKKYDFWYFLLWERIYDLEEIIIFSDADFAYEYT